VQDELFRRNQQRVSQEAPLFLCPKSGWEDFGTGLRNVGGQNGECGGGEDFSRSS